MNIKKMIVFSFQTNKNYLRFKYYGDFHSMKYIIGDCKENIDYIGNSNLDGAPIFNYKLYDNFNIDLLYDFKKLNIYLRVLKLRKITKNDLNKKEKSILTFFRFFMNSDENALIKGVGDLEVRYHDYSSEKS